MAEENEPLISGIKNLYGSLFQNEKRESRRAANVARRQKSRMQPAHSEWIGKSWAVKQFEEMGMAHELPGGGFAPPPATAIQEQRVYVFPRFAKESRRLVGYTNNDPYPNRIWSPEVTYSRDWWLRQEMEQTEYGKRLLKSPLLKNYNLEAPYGGMDSRSLRLIRNLQKDRDLYNRHKFRPFHPVYENVVFESDRRGGIIARSSQGDSTSLQMMRSARSIRGKLLGGRGSFAVGTHSIYEEGEFFSAEQAPSWATRNTIPPGDPLREELSYANRLRRKYDKSVLPEHELRYIASLKDKARLSSPSLWGLSIHDQKDALRARAQYSSLFEGAVPFSETSGSFVNFDVHPNKPFIGGMLNVFTDTTTRFAELSLGRTFTDQNYRREMFGRRSRIGSPWIRGYEGRLSSIEGLTRGSRLVATDDKALVHSYVRNQRSIGNTVRRKISYVDKKTGRLKVSTFDSPELVTISRQTGQKVVKYRKVRPGYKAPEGRAVELLGALSGKVPTIQFEKTVPVYERVPAFRVETRSSEEVAHAIAQDVTASYVRQSGSLKSLQWSDKRIASLYNKHSYFTRGQVFRARANALLNTETATLLDGAVITGRALDLAADDQIGLYKALGIGQIGVGEVVSRKNNTEVLFRGQFLTPGHPLSTPNLLSDRQLLQLKLMGKPKSVINQSQSALVFSLKDRHNPEKLQTNIDSVIDTLTKIEAIESRDPSYVYRNETRSTSYTAKSLAGFKSNLKSRLNARNVGRQEIGNITEDYLQRVQKFAQARGLVTGYDQAVVLENTKGDAARVFIGKTRLQSFNELSVAEKRMVATGTARLRRTAIERSTTAAKDVIPGMNVLPGAKHALASLLGEGMEINSKGHVVPTTPQALIRYLRPSQSIGRLGPQIAANMASRVQRSGNLYININSAKELKKVLAAKGLTIEGTRIIRASIKSSSNYTRVKEQFETIHRLAKKTENPLLLDVSKNLKQIERISHDVWETTGQFASEVQNQLDHALGAIDEYGSGDRKIDKAVRKFSKKVQRLLLPISRSAGIKSTSPITDAFAREGLASSRGAYSNLEFSGDLGDRALSVPSNALELAHEKDIRRRASIKIGGKIKTREFYRRYNKLSRGGTRELGAGTINKIAKSVQRDWDEGLLDRRKQTPSVSRALGSKEGRRVWAAFQSSSASVKRVGEGVQIRLGVLDWDSATADVHATIQNEFNETRRSFVRHINRQVKENRAVAAKAKAGELSLNDLSNFMHGERKLAKIKADYLRAYGDFQDLELLVQEVKAAIEKGKIDRAIAIERLAELSKVIELNYSATSRGMGTPMMHPDVVGGLGSAPAANMSHRDVTARFGASSDEGYHAAVAAFRAGAGMPAEPLRRQSTSIGGLKYTRTKQLLSKMNEGKKRAAAAGTSIAKTTIETAAELWETSAPVNKGLFAVGAGLIGVSAIGGMVFADNESQSPRAPYPGPSGPGVPMNTNVAMSGYRSSYGPKPLLEDPRSMGVSQQIIMNGRMQPVEAYNFARSSARSPIDFITEDFRAPMNGVGTVASYLDIMTNRIWSYE